MTKDCFLPDEAKMELHAILGMLEFAKTAAHDGDEVKKIEEAIAFIAETQLVDKKTVEAIKGKAEAAGGKKALKEIFEEFKEMIKGIYAEARVIRGEEKIEVQDLRDSKRILTLIAAAGTQLRKSQKDVQEIGRLLDELKNEIAKQTKLGALLNKTAQYLEILEKREADILKHSATLLERAKSASGDEEKSMREMIALLKQTQTMFEGILRTAQNITKINEGLIKIEGEVGRFRTKNIDTVAKEIVKLMKEAKRLEESMFSEIENLIRFDQRVLQLITYLDVELTKIGKLIQSDAAQHGP